MVKRQESTEDYLETILVLGGKIGNVRSIDIVNEMGFSKPSVSIALKNLRQKELVKVDSDGYVTLTQIGLERATCVYERHTVLTNALIAIGVSAEVAREDACRVEHDISDETFERIKVHLDRAGKLDRKLP